MTPWKKEQPKRHSIREKESHIKHPTHRERLSFDSQLLFTRTISDKKEKHERETVDKPSNEYCMFICFLVLNTLLK